MILDYVANQTIEACFASRNLEHSGQSKSLASNLAMSDAFLSIFRARHPIYKPDPELRLRILLLKLSTLFTQRLTSNPATPSRAALLALRSAHQVRARSWIGSADRIPSATFNTDPLDASVILPQGLERNRAHVLHELGIPAEDEDYDDAFYGTTSCLSLLDILPLFMQVSAARNAMNGSNLTELWMTLACEFMLQACLEQYLVFGAQGSDAVDEAFAWGYNEDVWQDVDADMAAQIARDDLKEMNEMFEDEDYATEVEGWSDTKMSYLEQLFLLNGGDSGSDAKYSVAHLETVAAAFPISTFETSLLKFLEALSKSIPEPILVQLEAGKLDGMTGQGTQEFLIDCDVDPAKVFEAAIQFTGTVR